MIAILKHKDIPVLEGEYDANNRTFLSITKTHDLRHLPPGADCIAYPAQNYPHDYKIWYLNNWLAGRSTIYNENGHPETALRSMSDKYWIDWESKTWQTANLKNGQIWDASGSCSSIQWNRTQSGWVMQKYMNHDAWVYEMLACECYDRLGINHAHYRTKNGYLYCDDMLAPEEELIPLGDVIDSRYRNWTLKRMLSEITDRLAKDNILPPEKTVSPLTQLITADYILAQEDRHTYNIALIRNADTLEYSRIAPIYDSDACLWCDSHPTSLAQSRHWQTKFTIIGGMTPLTLLHNVQDLSWFQPELLNGFPEKVTKDLNEHSNTDKNIIPIIEKSLRKNINIVTKYKQKLHNKNNG